MKTSLVVSLTPTAPTAPLLFSGRLEEGARAAAELGFDGLELSVLDPATVDARATRQLLQGHGLSVSAINTSQAFAREGLGLANLDADVRRRAMDRLHAHAHLASTLGAPVSIGMIRGTLVGEAAQRAEGRKHALDGLSTFAAFAAKLGVSLYLEPINHYDINLINTIAQCLEFLDEMAAPNASLLADTYHMNIEEGDMAAALRQAGKRLGYVHFVDSNRQAPGCGHTDMRGLLGALRSMGYAGFLTMEIYPVPDDLTAATRSAEFFRSRRRQPGRPGTSAQAD